MSVNSKRVVVIGGSSGLGLATAKMAAAKGAAVVIASRSAEKLERARAEIEGAVETRVLDFTDESAVEAFFDALGCLDHLATPAAVTADGPFLQLPLQTARAAFDSKFWGQFYAARHAAPRMRPGGSIVLFSGNRSQRPAPGGCVMAAINSAVEGLGRGLAVELAPLRVNVMAPGVVDTPRWDWLPADRREAMYQEAARTLLVQRVGQAEDIALGVLYLMENGFATGTTLFVDGGGLLK